MRCINFLCYAFCFHFIFSQTCGIFLLLAIPSYIIDPDYLAELILFQNLTQGSSFMPDKGSYKYHMTHSVNTSPGLDHIFYDHSFSQLDVNSINAQFMFPIVFSFILHVQPLTSVTPQPSDQLILSKKITGGKFLELRLKNVAGVLNLVAKSGTNTIEIPNFFTYDQWTMIGVSSPNTALLKILKDNTHMDNLASDVDDELNHVFF